MAKAHNEYDGNMQDGNRHDRNNHQSFFSKHPFFTIFMVVFLLSNIGGAVATSLLFILWIGLLLFISIALGIFMGDIVDDMMSPKHHKGSCKPYQFSWHKDKVKHSQAPEGITELAKKGNKDAIMVASEYDSMIHAVSTSSMDVETIKAQYSEKMKKTADLISSFEDMSSTSYPDIDSIQTDYHNTLESLIQQFHETVNQAGKDKVRDMKSYMSSIRENNIFDLDNDEKE